MFLGPRLIESRLLLGMLKVDSFPSIHNSVVDGIPENYVHYYKKYLYEIEFFRFKKGDSADLRYFDVPVAEKEKQLVINFKFEEK
nr:MAG TPA: hypothetical protein [Microviridae sp.]